MSASGRCPCGSGEALEACCGRFLDGGQSPATAEQLMRSRYSAYVLRHAEHLRGTWHSSTRPAELDIAAGPEWLGLEIRATEAGGPAEAQGTVEFLARYREGKRMGVLHETSRFVRENGRWVYLDGRLHPAQASKPGRNQPCPCGSGRKFKHCCAR